MSSATASPIPKVVRQLNGATLARLGPLLALVLLGAVFSLSSNVFLSPSNLSLIIQQITVLGVLAIGQMIIVLTAGIDLSCGAAMALGGIVVTRLATVNGLPVGVAVVLGFAATAAIGAVNGGLVAFGKLPAFIVTLGMLNVATAVGYLYSNGQTVVGLPPALTVLGDSFRIGSTAVAYSSVLVVAIFVLFGYVLTQTAWGVRVHIVGDNAEAARLMGIPVRRILLSVYVIAGLLYGLASLLETARTGAGDPYAGLTLNLDSVTAVVLGGTSLFGGRGSIWGTFCGVLVIGVLANGLVLLGADAKIQTLVTGVLVVVAVLIDKFARRRS